MLKTLEKANWFARVGLRDNTEGVTVLASWQEAIEHFGSDEAEDLCLDAANQYCERLIEIAPERFNQWNDIVRQLKPITMPLVCQKIEAVVQEQRLPRVFESTVQWDILHVFMEAEYADVCPSGYYASLAHWYVQGHFPCGWEGEFPIGKLIIY